MAALSSASAISGALLRRPGKKQASNTRGVQSRLEMLTLCVEERALLAPSSGVSADALVAFCTEHGTFAHANGEMRHATCVGARAGRVRTGQTLTHPATPRQPPAASSS